MASGKLGSQNITSASTNTTLYTVPASTFTVATVSLCNRSNSVVSVRLAIADVDTPTDDEWIEYDTEVYPKSVLERTGLVLAAGEKLVVSTTGTPISAVAYGIESEV